MHSGQQDVYEFQQQLEQQFEEQETQQKFSKALPPILNLLAILTCLLFVFASFKQFVPLSNHFWVQTRMGFASALAMLFVGLFIFKRHYFSSFFISMFVAFFLFLDVLIVYDDYAIELTKEQGPNGIYRSIIEIFVEVFSSSSGARLAILAISLNIILILFLWIQRTCRLNRFVEQSYNEEKNLGA